MCSAALLKALVAVHTPLRADGATGLGGVFRKTQSPDQNCNPSVIFVVFLGFFPFQAFPDNAARREVESLPAVCINSGCTWKGTIKEYEVQATARLGCLHPSFLCFWGRLRVLSVPADSGEKLSNPWTLLSAGEVP